MLTWVWIIPEPIFLHHFCQAPVDWVAQQGMSSPSGRIQQTIPLQMNRGLTQCCLSEQPPLSHHTIGYISETLVPAQTSYMALSRLSIWETLPIRYGMPVNFSYHHKEVYLPLVIPESPDSHLQSSVFIPLCHPSLPFKPFHCTQWNSQSTANSPISLICPLKVLFTFLPNVGLVYSLRTSLLH